MNQDFLTRTRDMLAGKLNREEYARYTSSLKRVPAQEDNQLPQDDLCPSPTPPHEPRSDDTPGGLPRAQEDAPEGSSQSARLLKLLQDGHWHDTPEIMRRIYKIGSDRGNCRIPSRIHDLRKVGHRIETKRITQTLTAYRLI